jgi:hypothetical protein
MGLELSNLCSKNSSPEFSLVFALRISSSFLASAFGFVSSFEIQILEINHF